MPNRPSTKTCFCPRSHDAAIPHAPPPKKDDSAATRDACDWTSENHPNQDHPTNQDRRWTTQPIRSGLPNTPRSFDGSDLVHTGPYVSVVFGRGCIPASRRIPRRWWSSRTPRRLDRPPGGKQRGPASSRALRTARCEVKVICKISGLKICLF